VEQQMAEVTTTPTPDVAEAPATSFDDKLAAKLGFSKQPAEEAPPEAEALPEGELSPDELGLESEAEPTDGEWLELDRKGERRKVSKEEAKRLAQQGWDYNTNQEALKAEKATIEQQRAALQAKAQITPQVIDAAANVRYYENMLKAYDPAAVNALAVNDPIQYIQVKAQIDQLREGMNNAQRQFAEAANAAQQVDSALQQFDVAQELNRIYEVAPELRDSSKMQAEQGRIRSYLSKMGYSDQELVNLNDARQFNIARDAMRYRQAVEARGQRVKDTPGLRPGPAPVRQSAEQTKANLATKLHRTKDPAQKKQLFDQLLAAKLAKFG
jgi:hypothetical protein